jgi:hypothetical protein
VSEHPDVADEGTSTAETRDGAAAPSRVVVAPGLSYEAAPTRKRGRETARDMVRTLLVILVPVLVLVFVVARQPSPDPVRVVDWKPQAALAAAQAPFPVVAPAGLEPSWRATSARYEAVPTQREATWWHVGFLTPESTYASLDQSDARAGDFVRDVTAKGSPTGQVVVGGTAWTRYESAGSGTRALVRPWGTSTVVVGGSAAWATLEHLASTLRELPRHAPTASGAAAAAPAG